MSWNTGAYPPQAVVPALVQHREGGHEYHTLLGNTFVYLLPNPSLAENCLVIPVSYATGGGSFSSITDDLGATLKTAPDVTTTGAGQVTSIFVVPNLRTGTKSITVNFTATVGGFHMDLSEFSNIASINPVNGTVSAHDIAAPNLACGSFTPTINNDIYGGNLIYAYFTNAPAANAGQPDHYTAGSGFTLLGGSFCGNLLKSSPNIYAHATEYFVQSAQAAINPGLTAVSESASDTYNCVAVALKIAPAGNPPPSKGIYLRRMHHFGPPLSSSGGTVKINCPAIGNLHVVGPPPSSVDTVSSVTDSDSNTYTQITSANGSQLYYAAGCPASPNLVVTIVYSTGSSAIEDTPIRFWDIERASSSPLGAVVSTATIAVPGGGHVDDFPIITPTQVGSLIISWIAFDFGPVNNNFDPGATTPTPASATFDLVNFTNQVDDSLIDNSDAVAHIYTTSLTAVHWNWVDTSGLAGNTWGISAEFLPG